MNAWRVPFALGFVCFITIPISLPIVEVFEYRALTDVFRDRVRLASLASTTIALVVGATAIALVCGTFAAVVLFRTDLAGRRAFRFATVVFLFIPLLLIVTAWQAAFGFDGWFPLSDRNPGMWTTGLPAAIILHGLAGIPWVVLIVGHGLSWVERELEEDALLATHSWHVLWTVTLPRCRLHLIAAALFVAVTCYGTITVTDFTQVRTFAEEAYYQLNMNDESGLARPVLVSLPLALLICLGLAAAKRNLQTGITPLTHSPRPSHIFALGRVRWVFLAIFVLFFSVAVLIPLASLIWKVGLQGRPLAWSATHAWHRYWLEIRSNGSQILWSFSLAAVAGVLATAIALLGCWLAFRCRWLSFLMAGTCVLAIALPGVVIGFGIKNAIFLIVDQFPRSGISWLIYDGPSPLPTIWAYVLRFLPWSVAMLWPVVQQIPQELRDAIRMDSDRKWHELLHVVVPLARRSIIASLIVVSALSLGELDTSNRIETAGTETFAHTIFDRMHYGVANDVAAMCLVMLTGIGVLWLVVVIGGKLIGRANSRSAG